MARPFTSTDASRLIRQHQDLLYRVKQVIGLVPTFRKEVKQAADALLAEEVMKVLRGIPIEEINRDKRGIRVKALQDYGYHTIADVASADVYRLSSIYGISQDAAYTIRRVVDNYAAQARTGIKVRISADNKTPASTRLVTLLSAVRRTIILAGKAEKLLLDFENEIQYAIEDLQASRSGLSRLFWKKSDRSKFEGAYQYLWNQLNGEYGQFARYLIDASARCRNIYPEEAWQDFQQNSIQLINILEDVAPGILGTGDAVYGLPEELAQAVQDEAFFPDGLTCELRRYQEWGVKYILHQERVLLGDEMGLGKTVQAIATMVSLKNTGATHFMVVCPASVITNWCREIMDKSKLAVTKIHGAGRANALKAWVKSGGVAVTTYETTAFCNLEDDFRFSLLVVDEAHYIKNEGARRTINVKSIATHAERLLFMTGTALENKVSEMVSLIQILQPQIANQVRGMEFLSSAPQFRQKVAPVYYRRKREDVLTELPEMIESKEWCTLLPEEEEVYEQAILGKRYADARRVSWSIGDLSHSSKAKRMLEIIEEAENDGRKIIVFSFFLDTIYGITQLLGNKCTNPINGSVPPPRRQEIIDEFDSAPAGTVLPAQIQSGGTGLNIQSASVVIICEPQLKPSIENQAISRAYRMGQTRNVLVYRLLCENTIDEKITDLLEEKQAIFDAFADKSEAAKESIALDDKTLGDIIQAEIDRINAKRGQPVENLAR